MEKADLSRPRTVEFAIYALAATLIVGLFRAVFGLDLSALPVDPLLFYGILFGSSAVVGLLLYKIWSRKNWARITYALLFALGMIKTVPALAVAFDVSAVAGLISASLVAIKLGAVVLLFLAPSNVWFRHAKL